MELVSSVNQCIEEAVKLFKRQGYSRNAIKAVGITNQRETTVVWDKETGEPLYNAIVWTDTRSAAIIKELKAKPGADKLTPKCGLPLSTYPSGAKLMWLLQHEPKVKEAYEKGRLAFGMLKLLFIVILVSQLTFFL